MSARLARVSASLLVLALASCQIRPYGRDAEEVSSRYEYKFPTQCSSWLRSPVTHYRYCSSPPFQVAIAISGAEAPKVEAAAKTGPTDEASLKANGAKVYANVCQACHGPEGKGVPGAFPPLAGSGGFYGDAKHHATIVVKGLADEITVQGQKFHGVMPAQGAAMNDYELASVLTFERTSWGNNDGVVLPADVAAAR